MSGNIIGFNFQIQAPTTQINRANRFAELTKREIESAGGKITSISDDSEKGLHVITIRANSEQPLLLWRQLNSFLPFDEMQAHDCVMIASCEGSNGWKNYNLLHHYDSSQAGEINVLDENSFK